MSIHNIQTIRVASPGVQGGVEVLFFSATAENLDQARAYHNISEASQARVERLFRHNAVASNVYIERDIVFVYSTFVGRKSHQCHAKTESV